MILTREEKEKMVLELLSKNIPIREIATRTNTSYTYIGEIGKKVEKEREAKEGQTRQRYLSSEAYKLFSQRKTLSIYRQVKVMLCIGLSMSLSYHNFDDLSDPFVKLIVRLKQKIMLMLNI